METGPLSFLPSWLKDKTVCMIVQRLHAPFLWDSLFCVVGLVGLSPGLSAICPGPNQMCPKAAPTPGQQAGVYSDSA